MITKINEQDFRTKVVNDAAAVVDFSATWCGPCRMRAPVLEEISEELTTMRVACEAIADMAGNFSKTLDKLQELFAPQIETRLAIIRDEGPDYGTFKRQSKDCVAVVISTAQAVKTLLDTPILEKNGALAEEARISLYGANKYLLTQGS